MSETASKTAENTAAEYIVLSAIGADKPGIVNDLSKTVTELKGNILDSRMVVMGGEFTLLMMVGAEPEQLTQLDTALTERCRAIGLEAITKKTQKRAPVTDAVPYRVHAVALDHPGIVHELAGFYSQRAINVEDMHTETYAAPLTGSPMFSLEMVVNIPARIGLSELKDQFFDFCDELNLDATIEPVR